MSYCNIMLPFKQKLAQEYTPPEQTLRGAEQTECSAAEEQAGLTKRVPHIANLGVFEEELGGRVCSDARILQGLLQLDG